MSDFLGFLLWWLTVTLFGLAAWPILFRLLRFLPDRGYSLAKTGGLLAVGYVGWLLGNFGFIKVDPGGVVVALLIVTALAAVCARGETGAMREWLSGQRGVVVAVELLFLIAFGVWAYARSLNPTITATEKPMEFAFLNSVLRTGVQPPGDPWLAGYAISYYHFGYVIIGMLTAITGVQPGVAFNLGISLLFGLTATGAFGIVLNLIAAASGNWSPSGTGDEKQRRRQRRWLAAALFPALLGPLFVLLGNLNGALEVAHKARLLAVTPEQTQQLATCPTDNRYCLICNESYTAACDSSSYRSNFWSWLDIKWTNNPPGVPVENDGPGQGFAPDRFLWWWQSSRVIHDRDLYGAEVEVIDEFPFFSFLLGDMHPHVLGLPFVFLALLVAINVYLMVQAGSDKPIGPVAAESRWARLAGWIPLAWPELLTGALVLGGLSFLNTWDFPIYSFVVTGAYVVARANREGWTGRVWRDGAIFGGVLMAAGVLLYLPFYLGFRSQLGGMLPNVVFGTRIQQFTVMFGTALFVLACVLGWLVVNGRRRLDWISGVTLGGGLLTLLIILCASLAFTVIALSAGRPDAQAAIDGMIGQTPLADALGLILQRRFEVERLLTPLLLAAILTVAGAILFGSPVTDPGTTDGTPDSARPSLPVAPFLTILVITGALLTLGPEFVYLRDFFGSRMNTVFKFYYQAWVLWSLASAFGVWYLLRSAGPLGRALFGAGTAGLVALGLIYPFLATATITDNWQGTTRDPDDKPYATLDGMAYMSRNRGSDYEAIKFLNATVAGRPVIVEAVGGSYTEYGRVSAHTGLPTVLGWPFHELQWRGTGEAYAGREDDVRTLYTSNSWEETAAILDKYHIRYVYVGQMEHNQYESIAFEKFDRNLSKIYENNGVIIYEYKGS